MLDDAAEPLEVDESEEFDFEIVPSTPEDQTEEAVIKRWLVGAACDVSARLQALHGIPFRLEELISVLRDHFALVQEIYETAGENSYVGIEHAHTSCLRWIERCVSEDRLPGSWCEKIRIEDLTGEVNLLREKAKTKVRLRIVPEALGEDLALARRQTEGQGCVSENKVRVEAFLDKIGASSAWLAHMESRKPEKKLLWRLAGHKQARQFERWQSGNEEATGRDMDNFERILSLAPREFVSELRGKGLIP